MGSMLLYVGVGRGGHMAVPYVTTPLPWSYGMNAFLGRKVLKLGVITLKERCSGNICDNFRWKYFYI
jgi:hypothetical protein